MPTEFRLWHRREGKLSKPLLDNGRKWLPVFGPASEQECESECRRLVADGWPGDWLVLAAGRDANDNTRPTR